MADVNLGFLSQISAPSGIDDIVGKVCQTYYSLHPCQELDIWSELSQKCYFICKFSSLVAVILQPRYRTLVTPNREMTRHRARRHAGPQRTGVGIHTECGSERPFAGDTQNHQLPWRNSLLPHAALRQNWLQDTMLPLRQTAKNCTGAGVNATVDSF